MTLLVPIEAIKVLAEKEKRTGLRYMATPGEIAGAYQHGFRDRLEGRPRGRASFDVFGAYDRGYNDGNIKSTIQ